MYEQPPLFPGEYGSAQSNGPSQGGAPVPGGSPVPGGAPPEGGGPPQGGGQWTGYGAGQPDGPVPSPPRHRRRRVVAMASAGALLAVGAGVGIGMAVNNNSVVAGSGSAVQALPAFNQPNGPGTNPYGNGNGGNGGTGNGGTGNGGTGNGSSGGTTTSATTAQQVGVVDINTVLGYQGARAAGTGMVLSSTGEILTNNHVVEGSTSISVTVVSTGKTYTATVVGTDPTADVAVIQLANASGLATANVGNATSVKVGDAVVGVGNAGGTGGTPSAASGTVTALNQSITASDASGQNAERLTGLIETNAPIVAGDSGGPLYDTSGKIIGIDTAASTSAVSTASVGYAIPINNAVTIAQQIENGQASSTVHLGYPGFLGVSVASANVAGAGISSVVTGGPAAQAGIVAGDVVTAVNGTQVTTATGLHNALSTFKPGQQVTITWTDVNGQSHHATVTLAKGPAD
ncbi:MAG: hypothetical protein JWO57_3993 [Pseudonocardiales bacterium]|nr:hypothetical protein [Pseudonocardiales bacterium]